jgi:hypothetical protein
VRKITCQGLVSTLAGTGLAQLLDGPATAASFSGPMGIAVCRRYARKGHCIQKGQDDFVCATETDWVRQCEGANEKGIRRVQTLQRVVSLEWAERR